MSQTQASQNSEVKTCTPSFSKKHIAVAGADGFSKTYANRSQAQKMATKMGDGWSVCQVGRPFFVVKVVPTTTWQATRFESIDALIEAAAQRQHEANLRDGGVFNDHGTRFSDIEIEREVAKSRGTTFVSQEYAFTAGLDVPCAVRYIKYVGWTPAV